MIKGSLCTEGQICPGKELAYQCQGKLTSMPCLSALQVFHLSVLLTFAYGLSTMPKENIYFLRESYSSMEMGTPQPLTKSQYHKTYKCYCAYTDANMCKCCYSLKWMLFTGALGLRFYGRILVSHVGIVLGVLKMNELLVCNAV